MKYTTGGRYWNCLREREKPRYRWMPETRKQMVMNKPRDERKEIDDGCEGNRAQMFETEQPVKTGPCCRSPFVRRHPITTTFHASSVHFLEDTRSIRVVKGAIGNVARLYQYM